jgi:hypothetical protein
MSASSSARAAAAFFLAAHVLDTTPFGFRDDDEHVDRMTAARSASSGGCLVIRFVGVAEPDERHVVTVLKVHPEPEDLGFADQHADRRRRTPCTAAPSPRSCRARTSTASGMARASASLRRSARTRRATDPAVAVVESRPTRATRAPIDRAAPRAGPESPSRQLGNSAPFRRMLGRITTSRIAAAAARSRHRRSRCRPGSERHRPRRQPPIERLDARGRFIRQP